MTPQRIFLGFLGLSLIAYAPSFDNAFREDDFVFLGHVAGNGWSFATLLPSANFAFYRPGALLLFLLEHTVFGFHSGAYLAFNYCVHALIAGVFLLVLLGTGIRNEVAVTAAGLFLIGLGHYGKQVMWASTSGPLMAVLLTMLAIYFVQSWLKTGGNARLMVLSAAACLAPAFHESGVLAPILAVTYAWIFGTRRQQRVLSGIAAIVCVGWLSAWLVVSPSFAAYSAGAESLWILPWNLLCYVGFLILPVQQSDVIAGLSESVRAIDLVTRWMHPMIGLAVCFFLVRRIKVGATTERFLVLWFFLSLVPYCLVQLPSHWLELRYLYFSAMPGSVLVATIIFRLGKRRRAMAVGALVVAAITLQLLLERKYDHAAQRTPLLTALVILHLEPRLDRVQSP